MTYKILKSNPRRNTHEFFVDTEDDLQQLPKEPASKALVATTSDNYICNNNKEWVKLKNSCCSNNNEENNIQFGEPIFINGIYDDDGDQTYPGFSQIIVSYFPFEDPAQPDNILFLKNNINSDGICIASGLYCALQIDSRNWRIESIVESDTNNKVWEENVDFIKKNGYIYFQVPKNNLVFWMGQEFS